MTSRPVGQEGHCFLVVKIRPIAQNIPKLYLKEWSSYRYYFYETTATGIQKRVFIIKK